MAENAHLYIWVPANRLVTFAIRLAELNGFTVRGVITWLKSRPGRPTRYLQANTELLLFCTRGDAPARTRGQQTLMVAPTQLSGEKPAEQYALIERVSAGMEPFAEFFARTNRPGFHAWGGELEVSDITVEGWPVSSDFIQEVA